MVFLCHANDIKAILRYVQQMDTTDLTTSSPTVTCQAKTQLGYNRSPPHFFCVDPPMQSMPLMAVLYMILSMVSYQISASFAKQLFEQLDPLTVTILRLSFATILVTLMFRSWKIWPRLKYLKWRDLLCYSASLCLMNILFYYALSSLPQGIAVGLEFIGPLGLALLSIQQRLDYIWVGLAIVGIALMVPWATPEDLPLLGVLCALGAGLCWAAYIYFGQRVVRQHIGMHALSLAIGLSAFTLMPFGLYHDASALIQIEFWPKALMIALLATAIPYALDLMALKSLSRMSYGTLSSLSPALAALTGLLLLGEQISWIQWIALGCVIFASIGVTYRAQKTASAS